MISVTSKSRYAVVALAELARSGTNPIPIGQVAERRRIPVQFLEQLFSTLRRAGLLTSHRGMRGGYTLSRPAEEITVAEIADAIEGQIFPMFCLEPSDHTCFQDSRCGLQGFWADVARAVQDVFKRTTVADLAARHRKMAPGKVVLSPEQLLSRLN